ncbi:hypothetical protein MesoLjLa_65380 (plasmid) [Mesorhizobium sp. L-2-11]|nr:hypothetical protein MesoLjLa_65380 [Mesorhizobium sp. L-2-11]
MRSDDASGKQCRSILSGFSLTLAVFAAGEHIEVEAKVRHFTSPTAAMSASRPDLKQMAASVIGLPVDELHNRALLNHLGEFQLIMRTKACDRGTAISKFRRLLSPACTNSDLA